MRKKNLLLFLMFCLAGAETAVSASHNSLQFDKSEYATRRKNLMNKIPGSAAILLGAQPASGYFPYVQNNDFQYFSGVDIPNAILIIDGRKGESILFFTISEKDARNDGISIDMVKNTKEATGIEKVYPLEQFSSFLSRMASDMPVIYTSFQAEELARECSEEKTGALFKQMTMNPWDGRLIREMQFVKLLKERLPQMNVLDCSPLIWDLRTIKSPAEIEILRRTGRIGVKAATEVMQSCRVGLFEYELSAVFEYICRRNWADLAYNVIISSDENHPYLHYYKHDRKLAAGDFLVVDAGPDLNGYDVDISISFPANGKFTARQREIYEAALAVERECISLFRPGITPEEIRVQVRKNLDKKGFDLNKDIFNIRTMQGGVSHYVGMAVHDVGGSPKGPLMPGMVFACDIYAVFPEEKLGVRVEDTVLITSSGCENLTAGIPREIREIEALMKQPGIIQLLKEKDIH